MDHLPKRIWLGRPNNLRAPGGARRKLDMGFPSCALPELIEGSTGM
ncbi:MAG: hypothetical protein H6657_01895 [Ardenticatenaceae bacterium]|nr:hypothetical protein [Ardenticatenaceae bacterium]